MHTATTPRIYSLSKDELAELGLRAFHQNDWTTAAQALCELIQLDDSLWKCRFYLAMAYFHCHNTRKARYELENIMQWCPDAAIKNYAVSALRALNGY